MRQTYDEALEKHVLPDEGGYTNDAADPGGPTNFGITIADARMYWKPDATAADVRRMPLSVAKDIYAKHYAAPVHYDELPAGVDYAVLDYGINSGVSRAVKVLQKIVGVKPDGKMGLVTLTTVAQHDPAELINAIYDERLAFLKSLKTWPTFGKGWGRRCVSGRAAALDFARRYPVKPQVVSPVALGIPADNAPRAQVETSAKAIPETPELPTLTGSKTISGGLLQTIGGGVAAIGAFAQGMPAWLIAFIVCAVFIGLYLVIKGRVDIQKIAQQFKDAAT
jgi:lysozyme family protein